MEILDHSAASSSSRRSPADILERGYEFGIGNAINEGFTLFKAKAGEFVGYTIVVLVILTVATFIPFGSVVISGPLIAGFFIMAHNIKTNKDTEFAVFFKGFDKIGHLLLYSLVSGVLIIIGFVFLILPGIYLSVAYVFGLLFVVFYNHEFWDGMEWSRKIVTQQWWHFFAFILVLGFINLVGFLALGVGLLVSIPVTYCAIYSAFDQITHVSGGNGDEASNEPHAAGSGYRK